MTQLRCSPIPIPKTRPGLMCALVAFCSTSAQRRQPSSANRFHNGPSLELNMRGYGKRLCIRRAMKREDLWQLVSLVRPASPQLPGHSVV